MTTGYGAIFAFGIANWLLLARATALWGGTRRIVWTMTIFYLITYVATITIATVASRQFVRKLFSFLLLTPLTSMLLGDIFYAPPVRTCAIAIRPNTFGMRATLVSQVVHILNTHPGAIWVPSIIFEIVLFGLLFTKLFSHARAAGGTCSKLISTLHRDGIVYFVVIFC